MAYPEENIPFRQFMDDPDIQWRTGSRPDYTQVRATAQWGMRSYRIHTGRARIYSRQLAVPITGKL